MRDIPLATIRDVVAARERALKALLSHLGVEHVEVAQV